MTIYNVLFGLISNGITLGKGDFLNVSSGGSANEIVIGSRGNLVVSAGGTATASQVDSKGTETVNSGGTASGSVVETGGTEQVNGGVITGTVLSGGDAYISAGTADFGVLSAGDEFVYSGGAAHGDVVSAKGKLFVFSAGAASGSVLSGGYEYAFSAGVVHATRVESGGVVQVQFSGMAMGSIVSSGGQETVAAGGVAEDEIISSGAFDVVFGHADDAVVGGGQNVFPGGVVSGTVVESGGIQLLSAGAAAFDTIVNNGGQQVMLAGGIASGTMLNAGGTIDLPNLIFQSGGSAILNPLNDVLTVVEGFESTQITLSGSYAAGSFEALQDSSSGTLITIAGADPPAARTLVWDGAPDLDFADAADWIDLSDDLNPAALAPDAADTVEFLSGGGEITGGGLASVVEFAGNTSWNVTSGASLSAETNVTVGQSGDNGLLIDDGASVDGLGVSDDISGAPGDAASVRVDGPGSLWKSSGELIVGGVGAGDLTIANSASLSAAAAGSLPALALGAGGGGTGSLTVTGAGSRATLTGQLDVGQAGGGTLTISNQGTVLTGNDPALDPSEGLDIAELSGGSGAVTVTDALLSNAGRFIVGDAGEGSLSIAAGGGVTTTSDATIANTASASGSSVTVTGAGSNLTVAGTLVVGAAGFGSLSLSQGASVTAGALDLAAGATGDGDLSLAGVGTTLTVIGALTLGDQAAGELSILGGAQMTIAGGVVGGTGAAAAGNLDIEGVGSQLTINGGTLVVGANGPAEFTLGVGATLSGEVATDLFGVTNEYGNVDPATDQNDGTMNVGLGNSSVYDFFVANSGTIKITSGTATFYTPLVTDETAATDGSVNGLWQIGAHDTLVMNATSVDNTQTFDLTSATGATLVIGQVPSADPSKPDDTFNGQTMPTLTASIAPGSPSVLAGWDAPIANYASGDVITLAGLTYGSATASGDVVTVWSGVGSGTVLGELTFVDKNDNPSSADAVLAAAQINALACFAAGTRIGTVDGLVAVERLRVGDLVVTVDGGCEPVVWVGRRAVDCARHPRPETVWPVRVRAGAFGVGAPARDVWLSPDHAVFVDGVLVPVKLLVNGGSIAVEKRQHVVYHHVELPEHAVILAEGLAVESYLDTGDRTDFDGGGTMRLYPDFGTRLAADAAMTWETKGAAPLVMTGVGLAGARGAVVQAMTVDRRESATARRTPGMTS